MNGSKLLGSLVRFELDWFFNLFFVLKSIYLTILQYSILTYINNYMLTYPFVLSSNQLEHKWMSYAIFDVRFSNFITITFSYRVNNL